MCPSILIYLITQIFINSFHLEVFSQIRMFSFMKVLPPPDSLLQTGVSFLDCGFIFYQAGVLFRLFVVTFDFLCAGDIFKTLCFSDELTSQYSTPNLYVCSRSFGVRRSICTTFHPFRVFEFTGTNNVWESTAQFICFQPLIQSQTLEMHIFHPSRVFEFLGNIIMSVRRPPIRHLRRHPIGDEQHLAGF